MQCFYVFTSTFDTYTYNLIHIQHFSFCCREAQYFDYGHQTVAASDDFHQEDGYGASVGYGGKNIYNIYKFKYKLLTEWRTVHVCLYLSDAQGFPAVCQVTPPVSS